MESDTVRPAVRVAVPTQFALGVALALLVAGGVGYRLLSAQLADLSGTVSLARGTLAQLPLNIGDWVGQDIPLSERLVQATDTDDHLNRRYVRAHGEGEASLFLAYGVRMRDLMPHRPEVCYPGAGWTLERRQAVELPAAGGINVPTKIHYFNRGGFSSARIVVLNYYIIDGQYCHDVSVLRSKSWRLKSNVRYVAQVQIVADGGGVPAQADANVRDFAADTAAVIGGLLTRVVDEASVTEDAAAEFSRGG